MYERIDPRQQIKADKSNAKPVSTIDLVLRLNQDGAKGAEGVIGYQGNSAIFQGTSIPAEHGIENFPL